MKRSRGLSVYFVVMLVLLALLVVPSFMDNNRIEYTRGELMNDLEAGRVVSADITPSRQLPISVQSDGTFQEVRHLFLPWQV